MTGGGDGGGEGEGRSTVHMYCSVTVELYSKL